MPSYGPTSSITGPRVPGDEDVMKRHTLQYPQLDVLNWHFINHLSTPHWVDCLCVVQFRTIFWVFFRMIFRSFLFCPDDKRCSVCDADVFINIFDAFFLHAGRYTLQFRRSSSLCFASRLRTYNCLHIVQIAHSVSAAPESTALHKVLRKNKRARACFSASEMTNVEETRPTSIQHDNPRSRR